MKKTKMDNSIVLISRIRENVNLFLINELEEIGLSGIAPSHGDIFTTLFKYDELTMTEIADNINRDRSTVTTLVKKLIKLGYVDSRENPEDRRSSLVFLTKEGKKLKEDFKRISYKLFEREYQGISEEERKVFLKILNKVHKNFS